MKIEELMINDLVMFDGEVYRVKGIYGNVEMVDITPYYLKNKEGLYLLPINKHVSLISPIPLTKEILKANGWELSLTCEFYTHKSGRNLKLSNLLGVPSISCFGKISILHYVHELQHALRLCGLKELADNFNI